MKWGFNFHVTLSLDDTTLAAIDRVAGALEKMAADKMSAAEAKRTADRIDAAVRQIEEFHKQIARNPNP